MSRKTRNRLILAVLAAVLALLFSPTAGIASTKKKQSKTVSKSTRQVSSKSAASKQKSSKRSRRARRARGQRAPEPARIQEIQQALIDRGYLEPPATGKWDDRSVEAMRRFQGEKGLDATGKFDALSLIKLGLGPPTAGVAAPREMASTPGNSNNGKH